MAEVESAEAGTTTTAAVADEEVPNPDDGFSLLALPTEAPIFGKVLAAPPPRGAAGVAFRQPGLSVDSLFMGSFHVAGCSLVGTGHMVTGAPRQDAYDMALTSTGRLVVAIADGMGSRAASQVGARLFCEAVTRLAAVAPDESASGYLTTAAEQATSIAASAYELAADDISFVAAVGVITDNGFEIARVGDVSSFLLEAKRGFTELFTVDEGHVNIVTNCLPSEREPQPEVVSGAAGPTVVLTTDGLANDLRMSEALRKWLSHCWRGPVDSFAMADAMRYRRQGSHDDRTAVVVSFVRHNQTQTSAQTEEGNGSAEQ